MAAAMTGAVEAVLPLAIDTLAMAIAVGLVGGDSPRLVRHGVLLAGAAMVTPLLGVAASPAIRSWAARADTVAIPLLFAVGILALLGSEHGWPPLREMLVPLGFGVGIDAVWVGAVDLHPLPVVPVLVAVFVQAVMVTALGIGAGRFVVQWVQESEVGRTGLAVAAGGAGALLLGMHLGPS